MAFYNNPAFGQAASNIAAMFAPPSGSEAAGWAAAKAKQEDAARRAEVYGLATAPDYNQEASDRAAAAAGVYLPTQSWRAVEMDDATKRYGFDTQATTGRYGHDRTFDASVQNNQLTNQRSAITDLFKPMDPGQIRPDVPAELMEVLGLPEVAAVAGAPKPLSETEVKGGILQGLDPDLQAAITMGSTPIDAIMTDEGPLNVLRPDAINRQPAPSSPGTPRGYMTPDRRSGTTLDGLTDAATGERLPQGTMPVSTQGTPEQTGLTTSTRGNVEKSEIAAQKFQNLLGLTRELSNDPTNFGIPGFVKGTLQDVAAMAKGVSGALGFKSAEEALQNAQVELVRNGVDPNLLPGVFDPDLAALQTTSDLLVFQAAAALAGQSGRDVSDRDVQMFKGVVGDPRAWTATPERFKAKLDQMERILNAMREVDQDALGGSAGQVQPREAVPAPAAAPASTEQPAAEEQWERGPDGRLRPVAR